MSPAPGARPRPLPAWRRAAHLFVFANLAAAAPLLDLLGREPTFLLAHRAGRADVWLLTLGLCFGLPFALFVVEAFVDAWSARLGTFWHLLTVAVLAAAAAVQALVRVPDLPPTASLVLAALAGIAIATATASAPPWRAFLAVLAPLLLVVPIRFLAAEGVAGIAGSSRAAAGMGNGAARDLPVVMVVFDELPLVSLMDAAGGIDASRFPAFAALAVAGTWYRGATTVAQNTNYAVPAILTGKVPDRRAAPSAEAYPRNLFALLAGSHRLRVIEPLTALCPPALCPIADRPVLGSRLRAIAADLAVVLAHLSAPPAWRERHLPPIDSAWTGFAGGGADGTDDGLDASSPSDAPDVGNPSRRAAGHRALRTRLDDFERFRASLAEPPATATFHFLHFLMPHVPWRYLPDGRHYAVKGTPPRVRGCRGAWGRDPWPPRQGLQRHLLQLGFADRLLGELLAALDAGGLDGETLVIVTADHGYSFEARTPCRRANRRTIGAILPVPLLVRYPAGTPGAPAPGTIDDRAARTVDIVPTVAEVLGLEVPGPLDGRSLLAPPAAPPASGWKALKRANGHASVYLEVEPAAVREHRDRLRDRQRAAFGAGPGFEPLFELAPRPALAALLGRPRADLPRPAGAAPVPFAQPERFEDVDPAAASLPLFVSGELAAAPGGRARELAVLVDGTVVAVTRTVPTAKGRPPSHYAALLPPSALRPGRNAVEVLEVTP